MTHAATRRLAILVAPWMLTCSTPPAPSARFQGVGPQEPSLAIVGPTLVDVTAGDTIADQTILIRGTHIVAVGKRGRVGVPRDAIIIDGRERYVIPGLWDMHVHAADRRVNEPLFMAYGITGVRDMATAPRTRRWRDEVRAGQSVGPRIVAAGPILDGANPMWAAPGVSLVVTDEGDARAAVETVRQSGWDLIKVYDRLLPSAYFAIARHARASSMVFAGHVPDLVNVGDAADSGQRSMEHDFGLDLSCSSREPELRDSLRAGQEAGLAAFPYLNLRQRVQRQAAVARDSAKCRELIQRLARDSVFWTPTIVLLRGLIFLGDSAEFAALDTELVRPDAWWRTNLRANSPARAERQNQGLRGTMDLFAAMQRAGVRLLAGTDLGNPGVVAGASLHEELGRLVEAGLTPAEALRSATLNPALYLRGTDSLGTIGVGKLADLVLLTANPLADIRNTQRIVGVVMNGHWIGPEERARLLSTAATVSRTACAADPECH